MAVAEAEVAAVEVVEVAVLAAEAEVAAVEVVEAAVLVVVAAEVEAEEELQY